MSPPEIDSLDWSDLGALLRERARSRGNHGFTFQERAGESRLTFAELDRRARAVALRLRTDYPQAESAILCYHPGPDFLVGFFGSVYAGITPIPAYPPRARRFDPRLDAIAGDCPQALVLTTRAILENKATLVAQSPRLQALPWFESCTAREVDQDWEPAPFPADRPAVLQYTSGSTSLPKGVILTQACIRHNLKRMRGILRLGPDMCVVCWLPAFHDMGLIGNLLQTVDCGADTIILSPATVAQDPFIWLQTISEKRACVSGGPCFIFQHCVEHITPAQRDQLDLSSWRVAYVGAEPIAPGVLQRFGDFFAPCGFRAETFFPTYGLAEGTLMITGGDVTRPPLVRTFEIESLKTKHPVPATEGRDLVGCGQALPDLDVCIVDPVTRYPVAAGEIGEIWVAGPSVAAGYWQRQEETAHTFTARRADDSARPYLRTGDLGFIDDELFITGRIKELIIIRGRNYYPQDLEEAVGGLSPLLGFHRGAAFAVDEGSRPRLVLVHEVVRGYKEGQGAQLFERARQIVAEQFDIELHELVLVRTGSLPRATSGKIQRGEACERYQTATLQVVESFSVGSQAALPVDNMSPPAVTAQDIRAWLVARLCRQLGRPASNIDVEQPFANFGLDSVSMVSVAADLAKWLQRPLPPTLLYDAPTIARLAANLAQEDLAGPQTVHAREKTEAIAIIGLGCRFPSANGPEQFWELLRAGKCAVGDLPRGRWTRVASDNSTHRGGFLGDVEHFDAAFFGIAPREAIYLDPQHRLLLEVAWETLEHAGMAPDGRGGTDVGVFVGISTSDYSRLLMVGGAPADAYVASGNALSMAAHRLSYHLDLRGPSMAVDTACSSSLVAVHLACQALRAGECDSALAGGVSLMLSGEISANLAQARMLSPTGLCKTFDASADGYVRGEGCGLLFLKPLSDALRDGDTVYAVIEGSAMNQDGRSNGITAPNQTAQVEVIRKALRQAQRLPEDISYVELHGTGTPLGDPIEFEGLRGALGAAKTACALGAVKTNLGHLEAAAGIASLLKTVLQLHHAQLVPHLHLREMNPRIALEQSRFHVPKSSQEWPQGNVGRHAGVSSFGFGGTNAHVIVGQAPTTTIDVPTASAILFPLSACTAPALREQALRYADWLTAHPEVPLADAAATAAQRRTHFAHRVGFVAQRHDEIVGALRRWAVANQGTAPAHDLRGRVAYLFTGQGAQYAGMGLKLHADCAIFREHLDRCAELLRQHCSWSLFEMLGDEARLEQTDVSQPALFALEYALARTWQAWGIEPAAVLGHSAGEYAAACIAGVFSLDDGIRLIVERGRAMQACPEGSMVACFAPLEKLEEILRPWNDRLAIAAINGPENIVVSGSCQDIRELQTLLTACAVFYRELGVKRAFHSSLIEPALASLHRTAAGVAQHAPTLPLVSNISGDFTTAAPTADAWVRHARLPVRFADGINKLVNAGITHFLEIGPGTTLARLGQHCVGSKEKAFVWLPSLHQTNADDSVMLQSLARLYQDGASVRWEAISPRRRTVNLPTYPFQRQRFWFTGTPAPASPSSLPTKESPARHWVPLSHWKQPLRRFSTGLDQIPGGLAAISSAADDDRQQRFQLAQFTQARRKLDELAADYIAHAFAALGWQPRPGEMFDPEAVVAAYGVLPRYRRLFERLLAIGSEEGWFEVEHDAARVAKVPPLNDVGPRRTLFLKQFPEFEADVKLVHHCGTRLAGVLRGADDPLQVLFGDDAAGLVQRMYEQSPVGAFYNKLLKSALEKILAKWPAQRTLRVLEVGAGTGATTAHILDLFSEVKTEYVYTDVSPLFLAQAKEKFKGKSHLQFRLLDLETSLASQGFAERQFDLIIASNVLHATADLRHSLGRLRNQLVPSGLLVLLEGTRPTRLLDLVFGLTEGWWKYTDTALRPNYPLLSPTRWLKLLREEKFVDATVLPADVAEEELDQAVVLALAPPQAPSQVNGQRNGHAGKNGTAHHISTWLVHSGSSSLAPLLMERLRHLGDRVIGEEDKVGECGHTKEAQKNLKAVVFAESPLAEISQQAAHVWVVTVGQAAIEKTETDKGLWAAEARDLNQQALSLIDLDPAQSLDLQAQCLLASLCHDDKQPRVAFRGDQRFVPNTPETATLGDTAPATIETCARADLERLPPLERRARLEDYLRAEFMAIAGLALGREDMARPLQALGLDSLMALQFRNRLEKNLGVTLSVVDFLRGLDLNQLVDNTLKQLAPVGAAPSLPPPASEQSAISSVPEDVDNLAEPDLDLLLQALLEE